ncbi:putative acetyltransferase At3g50280 [Silene latifolia]|uniref:putative acetyltransferase At3g50280 n=1 Tax=Silene latifolia TaxID=37657 RepID=UPI003D77F6B5
MASNDVEVKLISQCFIKPKSRVEESEKPRYLVAGDLRWLAIRYIQTGFVYKKPITNDFDINSFVEKLKQSLSHALVYYYPLAGRFTTVTYADEHACSIHVDCNKGPGALFIHASCVHASVLDIVGHTSYTHPIIGSFFNLGEAEVIGYDGHTRALLTLQVTELKDAVFIGFTMNHSIADGTSFMQFVSSLSEIFCSENDGKMNVSISHLPIFEPFIPEGCNLLQKLPYLEPNKIISRLVDDPRVKDKIFHFSSSSILNLKKKANLEWSEGLGKISSFQALVALVWISIIRAQKLPAQAMATCVVPVDSRARFNPPLSPDQFGNLVVPLFVKSNVSNLVENGLGRAAMLIHQGVAGYDHNVAAETMKAMMNNPFVIGGIDKKYMDNDKINMLNFAWASKFDIYGVDFGLGKPVAVPSGKIDKKDGMVVVKAAYDGGGSIDLEVSLCAESMIALESDQEFMEFASSF